MTDTEDISIYMILNQLVHLSRYQAFKRLDEFDLRPNQAGILFTLNCHGKLSQKELAQKIGITPPSMTVALKKLAELGYIKKMPDENDQRIVRIFLDEKGKSCVENIKGVLGDLETMIYQGMSPEEILLLRRLLIQMRQSLLASKDFRGMDMDSIMRQTHPPMKERF